MFIRLNEQRGLNETNWIDMHNPFAEKNYYVVRLIRFVCVYKFDKRNWRHSPAQYYDSSANAE